MQQAPAHVLVSETTPKRFFYLVPCWHNVAKAPRGRQVSSGLRITEWPLDEKAVGGRRWVRSPVGVRRNLAGTLFAMQRLGDRSTHLDDFVELAHAYDPERRFWNPFLDRFVNNRR